MSAASVRDVLDAAAEVGPPASLAAGHSLVAELVLAGLPGPAAYRVSLHPDQDDVVTLALTLGTADELAAWVEHVDTTGATSTMRVGPRLASVLTGRLSGARVLLEREIDVRALDAPTVELPRDPQTLLAVPS